MRTTVASFRHHLIKLKSKTYWYCILFAIAVFRSLLINGAFHHQIQQVISLKIHFLIFKIGQMVNLMTTHTPYILNFLLKVDISYYYKN